MCEIHKALFHQRLERTDADNVAHELAGHNTSEADNSAPNQIPLRGVSALWTPVYCGPDSQEEALAATASAR
jgi:hypothetical protein